MFRAIRSFVLWLWHFAMGGNVMAVIIPFPSQTPARKTVELKELIDAFEDQTPDGDVAGNIRNLCYKYLCSYVSPEEFFAAADEIKGGKHDA